MPAIVKCRPEQRQPIAEFLTAKLEKYIEDIDTFDEVSVEEIDDGLKVEFPVGEIYGYTADYVQCVGYLFEQLKADYPDVGIWGVAYEYETITANTFGPFFYCKPEDKELTTTFQWHMCAECNDVFDTEVFYNSSQWDWEEGNEYCLCCPTCMLMYAAVDTWGDVEANASVNADELDEEECERDALKLFLWNRLTQNLDAHMDDFRKNRERIETLLTNEQVPEERKEIIQNLLNKM